MDQLRMGPSIVASTTFGLGNSPSSIAAVPMKLYANWEVDRASSSAVQRVFSMNINRIQISKFLKPESSFIIAVRLQGHKRTLRSNDISLPQNPIGNNYELNVDISFTIQYCHFFKRKTNIFQVLVQRRKRYKNRHIPGFKTLAIGYLNLDDVLQQGGAREVRIWDTVYLNKTDADFNEVNAGTVYIMNCQSQALEAEGSQKAPGKEGIPLSDEDEEDTSEESDFEIENPEFPNDGGTPRYGNQQGVKQRVGGRTSRKKLNQKNIKSKLSALLKRFRAQDGAAGPSTGRLPPTEEELEEIFEELENISDSGPELEPDKMSIMSNPKPGLRPFFGSKTDLPPIEDAIQSEESPPDTDDPEYSSDNENTQPLFLSRVDFPSTPLDSARSQKISNAKTHSGDTKPERSSSIKEKDKLVHSNTAGSIGSAGDSLKNSGPVHPQTTKKVSEANMISDIMLQLDDPNFFIASNVWICSSSDLPWISRVDNSAFKTIKMIDCPTVSEVKTVLQAIVARIQKFCNSNSEAPPQTLIGILGGDKLVVNVLRVYVDLLQNKTTQTWLNYLRFNLLIPPNSVIGRTLAMIADGGLMEVQWKALNKINPNETSAIEDCLLASTNLESLKPLNIPIGEVMLQLHKGDHNNGTLELGIGGEISGESQVFIPFVAEIHLGNLEELNSLHYVRKEEEEKLATPPSSTPGHVTSMSPPASPQMSKLGEWKELQIEYWTTGSGSHDFSTPDKLIHSNPTANPTIQQGTQKGGTGGKFSMKASVRTLSIAREPLSTLLSMLFVKERKKDKVLQKLGRKTKPRSSDSFNSQIAIDGVTWNRVRFFQITAQWQTHVKFLPISVPSSAIR
ncbi:hypothetical protein FO519_002852 [Halicephalobus sp. NKZ332]|nr:hypothetical protein FO519_002852 [Halicephalobus sp. NKZ332]